MISVNDLYEDALLLLNKGLRGWATPARFNRALRQVDLWLFNHYLGRPEEYQPGRPVPRIAYGMTMKVDRALSPFVVAPVELASASSAGNFSLPTDCEYPTSLANKANRRTIEIISEDEFADRASSSLLAPTVKHPVGCFYGNTLSVLPESGVTPSLSYLRLPMAAKWAYTVQNGRPVFDTSASVNSEWLESDRNKLVERIVWQLGENQKASDVVQQSQIKTQLGT